MSQHNGAAHSSVLCDRLLVHVLGKLSSNLNPFCQIIFGKRNATLYGSNFRHLSAFHKDIDIARVARKEGRKDGRRPLTENELTEVWEGGKGHLRQNQSSVAPTRAGPVPGSVGMRVRKKERNICTKFLGNTQGKTKDEIS